MGSLQLPFPDRDTFCIMALRAGGGSVDGAVEVIKNYFQIKTEFPQYTVNATPSKMDFVFKDQINAMLLHRDKHGRRIYIYRPGKWNPDKIKFSDVFGSGFMLNELVAREAKTQIAGVSCICDAENFGWKQLRNFTLDDAKNCARFMNDSFPLWFRQIHVVKAPRFFHLAFQVVKPFLNERIRNHIHIHGDDMASLHKFFSKDILPEELGGTIGPFNNKVSVDALWELEEFFDEMQKYTQKKS